MAAICCCRRLVRTSGVRSWLLLSFCRKLQAVQARLVEDLLVLAKSERSWCGTLSRARIGLLRIAGMKGRCAPRRSEEVGTAGRRSSFTQSWLVFSVKKKHTSYQRQQTVRNDVLCLGGKGSFEKESAKLGAWVESANLVFTNCAENRRRKNSVERNGM